MGISEVFTPLWTMKLVDACCDVVEKCHILSYEQNNQLMPSGSAS